MAKLNIMNLTIRRANNGFIAEIGESNMNVGYDPKNHILGEDMDDLLNRIGDKFEEEV